MHVCWKFLPFDKGGVGASPKSIELGGCFIALELQLDVEHLLVLPHRCLLLVLEHISFSVEYHPFVPLCIFL